MTQEEVFLREDILNIVSETSNIGEQAVTNIIFARITGLLDYLRIYGYLHQPYMDNGELYQDYVNKATT